MPAEIPFDIKYIPNQATEIAHRYTNLSRVPILTDPLRKYLEGVAVIPKFEAVALELMPPTLNEPGKLILSAIRVRESKRDLYDFGEYMSRYYEFKDSVREGEVRFQITTMFLGRLPGELIQDAMKASLEQFFEPNPLNLGYHPVDPVSDALPIVTLAIVNREQAQVPRLQLIGEPRLKTSGYQPTIEISSN